LIYLDTSLLLKRYCQEAGSDDIRKLLSNIKGIATSELAYVEFFSALSRKRREGAIVSSDYREVADQFTTEWNHLSAIRLSPVLVARARSVSEKYPLRAVDVIHLASALILFDISAPMLFGSTDERLLKAASIEGLPLLQWRLAKVE
jgi:uncharacterized protein